MPDPTLVRMYDAVDADAEDDDTEGGRVNRPYKIYPDTFHGSWEEVEPFVPYDTALDSIAACLPALERFPDEFPLEVRTVAGDDSWLSPAFGRDSVTINVCRTFGRDNGPFFRAIEDALAPFQGRPHWGKQPYLGDAEAYRAIYPRWDDFIDLRRQLDPTGIFLNAPLRALLE
jgi:FAD/FMN-containing dehydrogenase